MVKPLIDCGFEGPQNHPIHWEMLIGNPMLRRYPKSEKHLQLIITTAITYSSELAGCSTASRFDLKREDSADETETEDEALMKTCAGDFRVFVFFGWKYGQIPPCFRSRSRLFHMELVRLETSVTWITLDHPIFMDHGETPARSMVSQGATARNPSSGRSMLLRPQLRIGFTVL